MRPFEQADFDEFAAIVANPEVQEFLGGPLDRPAAWLTMARLLGHEVLRGWSHNALIEKGTGRLLGRSGLWYPEGWPGVEVGWVLARREWGKGYATEAAAAWRDWAFDVLGLPELLSIIEPGNVRSIQVAERIGHRLLRGEMVDGRESLVYGQQRAG